MRFNAATLAVLATLAGGALAAQGPEAPPAPNHPSGRPRPGAPPGPAPQPGVPGGPVPPPGMPAGSASEAGAPSVAVTQPAPSSATATQVGAPSAATTQPSAAAGPGTQPGAPSAPATTPAPSVPASGGEGGGDAGPGGMTIDIINSWSSDLSVSYGSNAGGPSPVNNPTAGPLGTSTRVVVPTSWAGRVYVGPGPTIDPMGTKVEGSTTGPPDIDVSYVDGYSVPMTCSVNNEAVAGCNIDLYANAKSKGLVNAQSPMGCPGKQVGSVCYNPSNTVTGNGPAPPFFAPCVGAAYTFPNDNVANVGNLKGNHIICCVGTSCQAPARQGKEPNQPSKRADEQQSENEKGNSAVDDITRMPGSGTLLAKHHKGKKHHPSSKGQKPEPQGN